jgi:hypothetical protein
MGEIRRLVQRRENEGRANALLHEAGAILGRLNGGDTAGWAAILQFAIKWLVIDRGPLRAREIVTQELARYFDEDEPPRPAA